jgi:hypothetical protein
LENYFEDLNYIPSPVTAINVKERFDYDQLTERALQMIIRRESKKEKLETRELCANREIRKKCFPEKKFFWKLHQRQCPTMNEFSPGIAEY